MDPIEDPLPAPASFPSPDLVVVAPPPPLWPLLLPLLLWWLLSPVSRFLSFPTFRVPSTTSVGIFTSQRLMSWRGTMRVFSLSLLTMATLSPFSNVPISRPFKLLILWQLFAHLWIILPTDFLMPSTWILLLVSLGGYWYALILVDRTTRYNRAFDLKTLSSNCILLALCLFHAAAGSLACCFYCDCDPKLFGRAISDYLVDNSLKVVAAPAKRQSSNGLVESHWKVMVHMARINLTEKQMP
jgi:hypothetical protein